MSKAVPDSCYHPAEKRQNFFGVFLQFQFGVDIEETKTRLTMQDVAQHYGFTPNRAGFIKCPFHTGDRTASLKVYPGGRGFHCFACNRGGSIIDFVAQLYDLSPLDAVRRLDADFRLNLPLDKPLDESTIAAVQRRKEVNNGYQLFEAWRGDVLRLLTASFREGHLALQALETPADLDRLTDTQALAIREQARFEWLADVLTSGTMAEMMQVFRRRKEVTVLCERILRHS